MIISVGSIVKLGIRPDTELLTLSGVFMAYKVHRFQGLERHQEKRAAITSCTYQDDAQIASHSDESTSVRKSRFHELSKKWESPF